MALVYVGSKVRFNRTRENLVGVRGVICSLAFCTISGETKFAVILLDGSDAMVLAFGHELEPDILSKAFDIDDFMTVPAGVLS